MINFKFITSGVNQHRFFSSIFLFLICIAGFSQANTDFNPADYGYIKDNSYYNPKFHLQVNIHPTWHMQSDEMNKYLLELGKIIASGDDTELKNTLEYSLINNKILLTLFKYEIGSPIDFNPGLAIVLEHLKFSPGTKNGMDYLFHVKKLMQRTKKNFEFPNDEFETVLLDKTIFYKMEAIITDSFGSKIYQTYFASVQDDLALGIVVSYKNEEDKKELYKMLNLNKCR